MDATLLCLEVLLCGMLTSVVRGLRHFENVAFKKSCTVSSRLAWSSGEHLPGIAVNGDTSGDYVNTENCIHTLEWDTSPWWEVDLGRPYPVYSVVVWARTDLAERMIGCVISVDGQECYRFNNTPVSRKTNVTCTSGVLNGSVIRVSKDTTGLSGGDTTINMCEFQVLSCSDDFWGSGCDRRCGNCSNGEVCDKVTGHCSSCPPGLQPPLCDTECASRAYEHNCTQTCSEGCEDVCDKVSGHCTCKPGWLGPACDAECPLETYGLNCMHNCSVYCSDTCDKATGHCTCQPGYKPPLCLADGATENVSTATGILVGAVIGSVCALVVLAIVVLFLVRWLRSRSRVTKGGRTTEAASYGVGVDSTKILPSTIQGNRVALSSIQSGDIYEPIQCEANHGYVFSQQAMPATAQHQTERSPVPAGEEYVVEGESSSETPRESAAPFADQPYEIVDPDRKHTYERPRLYVNTGDQHVYSDLRA